MKIKTGKPIEYGFYKTSQEYQQIYDSLHEINDETALIVEFATRRKAENAKNSVYSVLVRKYKSENKTNPYSVLVRENTLYIQLKKKTKKLPHNQ